MKTGAEDTRKKMIAGGLGALALLLVGYQLYDNLGGGTPTPRPPAPVTTAAPTGKAGSGPAAVKIGTTSAQLDPTLHMEPMLVAESLVYSGSGRNIFAPGSPEPVAEIVKPIAPPRPTPKPQPVADSGPPPKPPLPPINLKFFGTATSPTTGARRAFLLNGDDVFVASVGDIVQRRYKIISIDARSIAVEDLPNSNRQTLPLVGP